MTRPAHPDNPRVPAARDRGGWSSLAARNASTRGEWITAIVGLALIKSAFRRRASFRAGTIRVPMSPGPDQLADNPSLLLPFSDVARNGVQIRPFSGKASLLGPQDVIHIHFPEWLVRWKSLWVASFNVVAIVGLLWLARRRGAVMVWTGHDPEPHELSPSQALAGLQQALSFPGGSPDLIRRRRDGSPVQSIPSARARVATAVVPHGHYRAYYQSRPDVAALRGELGLDQRPVLLCFGLVRPYKNVPGIIKAWKQLPQPRPQLVIAGRPMDAATAEAIMREADGAADVHLLLRFIPAEDVPTLFAASDVAILPYIARSALTSGAAHLALSLNTPAVVNDTPVAQDLRDLFGKEWVWLYDGTAEDAMQQALAARSGPAARTGYADP